MRDVLARWRVTIKLTALINHICILPRSHSLGWHVTFGVRDIPNNAFEGEQVKQVIQWLGKVHFATAIRGVFHFSFSKEIICNCSSKKEIKEEQHLIRFCFFCSYALISRFLWGRGIYQKISRSIQCLFFVFYLQAFTVHDWAELIKVELNSKIPHLGQLPSINADHHTRQSDLKRERAEEMAPGTVKSLSAVSSAPLPTLHARLF